MSETHQGNFEALKRIGVETRMEMYKILQSQIEEVNKEQRELDDSRREMIDSVISRFDQDGAYRTAAKEADDAYATYESNHSETEWEDFQNKSAKASSLRLKIFCDNAGGEGLILDWYKQSQTLLERRRVLEDEVIKIATELENNAKKTELDK